MNASGQCLDVQRPGVLPIDPVPDPAQQPTSTAADGAPDVGRAVAPDSEAPPEANPRLRRPRPTPTGEPLRFAWESVRMGWRWLIRMRTALYLLGLVGLMTLLATVAPQEPNVPTTVEDWRTGAEGPGETIAGMIDLVRHMVQLVNVSLVEAVRMATRNPARALGLEGRKGVLAVGADADLVSFTPDFAVTHTIIAGRDVL